ncbi:GNAT family N-acetyltransferase [Arthrobacter sp. MYb227]|uniref:GNAT family N-acetyltransferase n=1 Tax=Arthrobacter sp. MYb227 TaxID=1848601 RepID=UPI000CFB1370|nr:GNAT family N-acetyltransferase [Arthrobacter sp. MYb227]PQZ96389.1 GNAT family N-acetyltransferase [Arthrobacter sp. MYb227]
MNPATCSGGLRTETISVSLDDPRALPLLEGLSAEYEARYGNRFGGTQKEMFRYPAADFRAPRGALLLLQSAGQIIAGGAFRLHDSGAAEFKRIWTHPQFRRQGLAQKVLIALEDEARALGYDRIYLTTGPRQPEAVGLYLRTGFTPLFDLAADPDTLGHLPFSKSLN